VAAGTGSNSGARARPRRLQRRAFSEVLRSGIQSIPKTQLEAARRSGLTTFQSYRYVILPVRENQHSTRDQRVAHLLKELLAGPDDQRRRC